MKVFIGLAIFAVILFIGAIVYFAVVCHLLKGFERDENW